MNSELRVIFFGTPDFVIPVFEALMHTCNVVGVVTAPDTVQGRKKILTPSPIKQYILQKHVDIPVITHQQLQDDTHQQLTLLSPDLFIVAAYGKIIPQSILDIPRLGALNIHPSLLPKYRGPSPIQTMLLHGDQVSGITIIKMDEKVDHGPIISQWEIPISQTDTFASLHQSMFKDASERLPVIMDDYVTKKITPQPQDETQATFSHMITRGSGYFESENPPSPKVLDQMIRAFYPWPTAWTKIKMKSGEEKILKFLPEEKIQIEGKNVVSVREFINGYPDLKEKILGFLGEN